MGLKGGKDGYVFKILPSHNTIKILDDNDKPVIRDTT